MSETKLTKKQLKKARKEADRIHDTHKAYRDASNVDFIIYIFIVLIAAFAIRLFVFEPVSVSGDSMINTLQDLERMFVEKVSYCFTEPKRGDIIICYYPDTENPSMHADHTCVKRVIALPGDTIEIKNGITYINDEPTDETAWIREDMWLERYYPKTTIPEDYYFVMGDNRNYSLDSRNPSVGPIPMKRIVGKVGAVIWPLDKFQVF